MRFKFFIFDFDGTIADTYSWFAQKIKEFADIYHYKSITDQEAESLRYQSHGEILKHLGVPKWKVPILASAMRDAQKKSLESIRIFDGMAATVQVIKERGGRLGIVSSNAESNVRSILKSNHLDIFDYYSCGIGPTGKGRKLRKIIKQSGFKPDESIYIGDELRDIEAARKTGVCVGVVSWGYNRFERLIQENPDYMFKREGDLVAMLCDDSAPKTFTSLKPKRK